jgi:hypothetical protein
LWLLNVVQRKVFVRVLIVVIVDSLLVLEVERIVVVVFFFVSDSFYVCDIAI